MKMYLDKEDDLEYQAAWTEPVDSSDEVKTETEDSVLTPDTDASKMTTPATQATSTTLNDSDISGLTEMGTPMDHVGQAEGRYVHSWTNCTGAIT